MIDPQKSSDAYKKPKPMRTKSIVPFFHSVAGPLLGCAGMLCLMHMQAHPAMSMAQHDAMTSQKGPALGQEITFVGTFDPQYPASVNRVRLLIMRNQYSVYQRQLEAVSMFSANTAPSRLRGLMCQSADEYNQVVAETDPSALKETWLPNHVSCPNWAH